MIRFGLQTFGVILEPDPSGPREPGGFQGWIPTYLSLTLTSPVAHNITLVSQVNNFSYATVYAGETEGFDYANDIGNLGSSSDFFLVEGNYTPGEQTAETLQHYTVKSVSGGTYDEENKKIITNTITVGPNEPTPFMYVHFITVELESIANEEPGPEPAGETWVINESPTGINLFENINFSSDNTNYEEFNAYTGGQSGELFLINYNQTQAYVSGGWFNPAYRTVTFETAPTGDLLTWLEANAVKQSEPEPPVTATKKLLKINGKNLLKFNSKYVDKFNDNKIFACIEQIGPEPPTPSSLTWVINESPDFNALGQIPFNIQFTSNNNSYNVFKVVASFYLDLYYDETIAYKSTKNDGSFWVDDAYRTITFEEEPTGDLLDWLNSNATKL